MKLHSEISSGRETGLIQVYTSPSKTPHYAPFGLALRASGYGLRTLITRFAPHGLMNGEKQACAVLAPNLVIDASALEGFNIKEGGARDAFESARSAAVSGVHDIVVLDGVLDPVSKGMIQVKEILGLMGEKAAHVELVLTGCEAADGIMEGADLVTEMAVHMPPTHDQNQNETPIEVVTGKGKGKTTYCLGKALLMSSMNVPSFVLQIIKSPKPYGEVMAIENLSGLEIETMGRGFVNKANPDADPGHGEAAREAWERAREIVLSARYGLVVLDEINIAVNYGFIQSREVQDLLSKRPSGVHLMLGGRYAHPDLMRSATAVMEMRELKHPYKNGVKARKGIEY